MVVKTFLLAMILFSSEKNMHWHFLKTIIPVYGFYRGFSSGTDFVDGLIIGGGVFLFYLAVIYGGTYLFKELARNLKALKK